MIAVAEKRGQRRQSRSSRMLWHKILPATILDDHQRELPHRVERAAAAAAAGSAAGGGVQEVSAVQENGGPAPVGVAPVEDFNQE